MSKKSNDLAWAVKISNITKSIYETFNKLTELEVKGLKDTKEYQNLIKNLSILFKIENEAYEQIKNDYESCLTYMQYFCSLLEVVDEQSKILILNRILINLNEIVARQTFAKEIVNIETREKIETISNYIFQTISKDYQTIFMYLLEEFIYKKENETLRGYLIAEKYRAYFHFIKVDPETINDFKGQLSDNDEIKATLGLYADLYYNDNLEEAMHMIATILNIKDAEYNNIETKIEAIILQCGIRTSLLLMQPEQVDYLNNIYHDYVDNDSKYLKNPSLKSEELVIYCFKHLKRDRANFYGETGLKRS